MNQRWCSENQVLKSMVAQHGLFVPIAYQRYIFSHLTLQEFLTAYYIKSHNLQYKLIDSYVSDAHWREVFILYAGHLEISDEFLINLKSETRSFITNRNFKFLKSLLSSVKEISESIKSEYSQPAVYALTIARAFDFFRPELKYRYTALNIITDIAFTLDPSIKNDFNNNRIYFYQKVKLPISKLVDKIDFSTNIEQEEMENFIEYLKSQLLLIECVDSSTCVSHEVREDIEKSILSIS